MPHSVPSLRETRPVRRTAPALTALALLVASITVVQAQTWNGGNGNWSVPSNWQGVQAPVSSASTAITFAGALRLFSLQDIASPFTLNSLSFSAGAGAVTIFGNALRFDGLDARLAQNSSNGMEILIEVQLATNLAIEGTGTITLGGNLSRATGVNRETLVLTKRGTGTLALAKANAYDATVRIDAGQVLLRDSLALQSSNVALNIDNGLSFGTLAQATLGGLSGSGKLTLGTTALTISGADTVGLYSGGITGSAGSVTKSGSGTARWSGVSQFSRLQVTSGRVQLEGGALTLTDTAEGLMLGNNSASGSTGPVLDISNGATASATGRTVQVDGAAGTLLSISGANSRLSTGFQTLVGNYAIGTLQVEDGGTLAAGRFLAMGFGGNGKLRVNPGGIVTGDVGLLGAQAGSTGTAEVSGTGARWTTNILSLGGLDASLRGGAGTLTVSNGGQVQVQNALTFWTAGTTATVNGGSLRVGTLASDGAVGSVVLQVDPAGGTSLVLDGSGNASFGGILSGAGSLLKTGSGAQTLAGANTAFTGVTKITGGRFVLGHQDALRGSTVRIDLDNGLDVNGLASVVVGSLSGSGALALGNTQFTLGEDGRATTYSGVLSGAGALLVKKGTGNFTLTGTGSSLNRLVVEGGGLMSLNGGSLALTSDAALQLNAGGRLEVLGGATLSANSLGNRSIFLGGDPTTELLIDGAGSRLNAGFQTFAGFNGQGRITVRNGGRFDGSYALVAGFGNGHSGTVSFESGAQGTAQLVVAGLLPGSTGNLWVNGPGTRLAATAALGLGGAPTGQVGGIGTLAISDGGVVETPTLRLWTPGSSLRIDGGSLSAGALVSTVGGLVTLASDPVAGRALNLGGNGGSASYNGDIDGNGGLVKTGISTQVLSGRNSFTGMVQVQGGTLAMATSSASEIEVTSGTLRLGERNLGFAVVQAGQGAEIVYTNTTLNGGQLIGPGSHDVSAVRRMVGTRIGGGTVLAPATGTTFVGVLNDGQINNLAGRSMTWTSGSNPTGSLVVNGTSNVNNLSSGGQIQVAFEGTLVSTSGNLVLGGGSRTSVGAVNQPGGTIDVRAGGRLQLNGGLLVNNGRIQGPVEVNFGGLAKGAGTYGAVTVNDGGRFSPGNSPGTVSTGDATWGSGGGLVVELADARGAAGFGWDLWRIDGSLSLQSGTTANSRFTVSLSTLDASNQAAPLAGFDANRAWQWLIVDTSAGIVGFDVGRVSLNTQGFLSPLGGGTLQLAVQDGDLYLHFAPVPEPQTWALMLGGLGLLSWAARRRRAG